MSNNDSGHLTESNSAIPLKRRCRGFSPKRQAQCDNKRLRWSKYCWHHQPWGEVLITLFGGFVIGFFTNILTNRITERKPELVAYINHERVSEDMVLFCPSNNAAQPFSFFIKNSGDMAA